MKELHRLIEIIAILRGPKGCPWDKAQDLSSMRPYLLEEVYEALDAMDQLESDSANEMLEEELGDLLFVVLLLCQIGVDENRFQFEGVCRRIANKMVVRHPFVFGEDKGSQTTAKGSLASWEQEKAKRNPKRSRLDGVPDNLPALLQTHRQGEKAAAVGFDWQDSRGVFEKMTEELGELKEALTTNSKKEIAHEYGDLLMATANLGRHIDCPPEEALRLANRRFKNRFKQMEEMSKANNDSMSNMTPESLEALWERAKALT